MLSKASKYAECGATASPRQQRRTPGSTQPSPFRCLLSHVSMQLDTKDLNHFKALVVDYGQEDDKGILSVEQLEEITTMFELMVALARVDYIQPDDLSNLVAFLEMRGHHSLVKREIEEFQKKRESK